jgi:hypothetical protein
MARSEQELAAERIGKGDKAKTKQAYYKLQREHAEESGDQATTDKIYSKLGKKSHNVDSARGDKAILGVAPFIPEAAAGIGEMAAARGIRALGSKAASMVPRLGRGEAEEVGEASTSMVPRRSSVPPAKSYQHLGRATPVKKALPSNKRALGSSTAPSVGSRTSGTALTGAKGPKALTGGARKSISSSGHSDYNAELGKQTKRSNIPGGKKGAVRGSRKKKPTAV